MYRVSATGAELSGLDCHDPATCTVNDALWFRAVQGSRPGTGKAETRAASLESSPFSRLNSPGRAADEDESPLPDVLVHGLGRDIRASVTVHSDIPCRVQLDA